MGELIYSAITSLDGFVADESGDFGWAEPDPAVHSFINDLERGVGTYLLGRRMYEVMSWWESVSEASDFPPHIHEFARIWSRADKVVYSSTLASVITARTRIEPRFDPADVRRMKTESRHDISIGGPTLAAAAIAADLVDRYQIHVAPVIVGGGLSAWPDGARQDLSLVDERRFESGFVYLSYQRRR